MPIFSTRSPLRKLPEDIASKFESLRTIVSTIRKLELDLLAAKAEQNRLESELAPYAPIHQLPTEILTRIFEEYIVDQPTHIRRLLLVCGLWHDIVEKTPRLWTNIQIILDGENLKKPRSLRKYVRKCRDNSGDHLLDVHVDYRHCISFENLVYQTLDPLFSYHDANHEFSQIIEDHLDSSEHTKYDDNCVRLLRLLVGVEATNMQRFKSLRLGLPIDHRELEATVVNLFRHDAPQLTWLSVDGSSGDVEEDSFFPSLPNLNHLQIKSSIGWLINFQRCPLLTLDIRFGNLASLPKIFSIKSLLSLKLRYRKRQFDNREWEATKLLKPVKEYDLPVLDSLTIDGDIPHQCVELFSLPKLKSLKIISRSLESRPGLPDASPSLVEWTYIPDQDCEPDEAYWTVAIRELVETYKSIKIIKVDPALQTLALNVVHDARADGISLDNLQILGAVGSSNAEEDIV